MTGEWVQLSAAASRIADMTGKPVSVDDIHRLADAGPLKVSWLHDHYGVLKSSLIAYLSSLRVSELAAREGEDLAETADRPLTPRDPANPAEGAMTHTDNYDYAREREN